MCLADGVSASAVTLACIRMSGARWRWCCAALLSSTTLLQASLVAWGLAEETQVRPDCGDTRRWCLRYRSRMAWTMGQAGSRTYSHTMSTCLCTPQLGLSRTSSSSETQVRAGVQSLCALSQDSQEQEPLLKVTTTMASAGSKLVSDLAEATNSGQKLLTVSPGVYRLTDAPLLISGTQGFTFSVSGVEIVVEGDIGAIRILNNTDLVIKGRRQLVASSAMLQHQAELVGMVTNRLLIDMRAGSEDDPFVIDSEPIGFTQGFITASSNESQTITLKLMDGYAPPVPSGRIELFAPNGTMLPHLQDEFQNVTDLGMHSLPSHLRCLPWVSACSALASVLDSRISK